jgi:hypothetical protein
MSDQIAAYTFLPWVRQGIASKIRTDDNLGAGAGPGERASVRISLRVNGEEDFVSKSVQLIGPGDVIGISPRAVVRTEPRNWVTDFEPNYLAFIEFYEEDFCWRYTPARAVRKNNATASPVNDPQQTKLRPWIFLLVLEEGEFEERPLSGPLPAIRLASTASLGAVLPPPDQAWAWAHVHVSRDITAAGANTPPQFVGELQSLVRQNPDQALSRLICPRKLKPSTAYHAFLIPSFEVGRLAGLGRPAGGLDALTPSWGAGQEGAGPVEYPMYYRWYFRTGERGDFEFLVNLLEQREVDPRVGIRDMDMQNPNFGVTGMSSGHGDEPVMGLEGALKSPQAKPRPAAWPPVNQADTPAFLNDLEKMVNLQETLQKEETVNVQETLLNLPDHATGHPDPIISPPLYGRWHALQASLEVGQPGWVNELNQDPRLRVPAGVGTQVVQTGQEKYMQSAWHQLGDILRANQKIRHVQVSIATSMRVYARHFVQLDPDQQIAVTRQVHARVMGSPTTVYQQLRESRLEAAAVNPAFRRIGRPNGPIMRKALPGNQGKPTDVLVRLNDGRISAALPKTPPAKQISLTRTAKILQIPQLREDNLTVEMVNGIPALPAFRFSLPGQPPPEITIGPLNRDSPEGSTLRTALLDLTKRLEISLPAPGPRPQADTGALSNTLVKALNPKSTILQRALSTIAIPGTFQYLRPKETIVPIMAHPVFADPMYRPLRDLSSELLIPNLNLIPNNTITLLETNPRFIEAYMVGLNHEMAGELLWREYPTDQRGSYFRQFWDVGEIVNRDSGKDAKTLEEELRDIQPLHLWKRDSSLGSHENRKLPTGSEPGQNRLVLVIRGDLLKRYPTAVIFAQEAKWVEDPQDQSFPPSSRRKIRILNEDNPAAIQSPIFKAEIEPDLHFLGFDLTASQAKGSIEPEANDPGWFFVIQERPGEPRFGLDITDGPPERQVDQLEGWNQLSWNHLGDPDEIPLIKLNPEKIPAVTGAPPDRDIRWGFNAADMAYILFQVPVMVAIHAESMLK